jgi:MFS family permease
MRTLLRNRDARIYLAGQAMSLVGDNSLWLAMGIWVKILTGSSSAAGLTFFAYVCGLLLAPAGGLIADRVRRRPLLIIANWTTGAGVCALLLVSGRDQLWLIYLVMFGYGVAGGLIGSAQTALIAVMLPDDQLGEANSLLQLAEVGLRVITPVLGAGLLAWVGPKPVILLDAGTFLGAGLALLALRLREPRPVRSAERWRAEVTAGLRHIGRTPILRRLLVSCVAALLVFGFFQTVPFAVVGQGLHRTPPFLGVLESVLGAGAVVGALLAAPLMRRTSERALVIIALAAAGLVCPLLMTGSLPLVLIAMAVVGACIVWVNVAAYTLIQRRTPPELIGRVDAALTSAAMIPQAVSIAVGAALVAVVNYRILLIAMSVAFLLSAVQMVSRAEPDAEEAPGAALAPPTADVNKVIAKQN